MWNYFDPTVYTRQGYMAHIASIPNSQMRWVKRIWFHNTGAPNIAQWPAVGFKQHLINLQHYYDATMGWHAGPHGCNSYDGIGGFSDLTKPGVHCSCDNSESLGFETVADFSPGVDDPTKGLGKASFENTCFVITAWCEKLGLDPDQAIHFHRECLRDHHPCPGKLVTRDLVLSTVKRMMGFLPAPAPDDVHPATRIPPQPPQKLDYTPAHAIAWAQRALNEIDGDQLEADDLTGPATKAALVVFQTRQGLAPDGILGPITVAALQRSLAAKGS